MIGQLTRQTPSTSCLSTSSRKSWDQKKSSGYVLFFTLILIQALCLHLAFGSDTRTTRPTSFVLKYSNAGKNLQEYSKMGGRNQGSSPIARLSGTEKPFR